MTKNFKRVGILETGLVSPELIGIHGSYCEMFECLFREAGISSELFHVKVSRGEIPKAPSSADLWIITGSVHAVYEPLPWIIPLINFLRKCTNSKIPIIGICFGHQLLALAFGGQVQKSSKGWGLGVENYKLKENLPWTRNLGDSYNSYAMHQDQVIEVPNDGTVIAGSKFCPNAFISYGDKEKPTALSIQSHPEFSPGYLHDLTLLRKGTTIPEQIADSGIQTLSLPVNNPNIIKSLICGLRLSNVK